MSFEIDVLITFADKVGKIIFKTAFPAKLLLLQKFDLSPFNFVAT